MSRYSHSWSSTESKRQARLRSSGPKHGTARQSDYGKCEKCGSTVVMWQYREYGCWRCSRPDMFRQAGEMEYIRREAEQSERDWLSEDDREYRAWSDAIDAMALATPGDDDL